MPPKLYNEVQKHLQEMIDVRAIWLSNSPWASAFVLVRKKNGKLYYCINLRKLNSLMVKDAYSTPRIQDILDCLQGAIWFTLLDLKSGYWQVELKEASKALTAFTVSPHGFYECGWMSLGLVNVPVMFQHLMKTCLGSLQFQWCIMYLDDIIILWKPQRSTCRGSMQYSQGCEKLEWSYNPLNVNFLNQCGLFGT